MQARSVDRMSPPARQPLTEIVQNAVRAAEILQSKSAEIVEPAE
jgi:hypothetical protein